VTGPAPLPAESFDGTPPFPAAAKEALKDDQLRANLGRATTTIREKRLRAVGRGGALANWFGERGTTGTMSS